MTMVIDGTNGLTFPDSSTETSTSLGYSPQTWTNVTSSRANGTTYTNSTGRPIFVSVTGASVTNANMSLTINSVVVSWSGWDSLAGGQVVGTISGIVPNGGTYSTSGWSSSSLDATWSELR